MQFITKELKLYVLPAVLIVLLLGFIVRGCVNSQSEKKVDQLKEENLRNKVEHETRSKIRKELLDSLEYKQQADRQLIEALIIENKKREKEYESLYTDYLRINKQLGQRPKF